MNKCATKYCVNKKMSDRSICGKCNSRKYRENNKIKAAFQNLRANAKRRGKEFILTFNEFEIWAIETEYIIGKGRSKHSFHIDRIDESKGYSIDNIQVLTNSENKKKYLRYARNEKGKPEHLDSMNKQNIPKVIVRFKRFRTYRHYFDNIPINLADSL